jgi:hypothetical protein
VSCHSLCPFSVNNTSKESKKSTWAQSRKE